MICFYLFKYYIIMIEDDDMKRSRMLLLVVLLLAIGFASVTATLIIQNNVTKFDPHFFGKFLERYFPAKKIL